MRGRYSTGLREVHGSGVGAADLGRTAARARRRAWLALAAWIGLIFLFSQGAFSADLTGSRLAALLQLLGLDPETMAPLHFFIRKGAHVLLYGGLGVLAARAAGLTFRPPRALPAALALGLAVAAVDEAHQATTRTRTGSPRDVALDFAGAALGAALWRWR
jgi:VanZ family protein